MSGLRPHRLQRPGKGVGQITGLDKARRQHAREARPLPFHVAGGLAIHQVIQLARIALEVVELVFQPAAVQPEINRVVPIAFARFGTGPASPARCSCPERRIPAAEHRPGRGASAADRGGRKTPLSATAPDRAGIVDNQRDMDHLLIGRVGLLAHAVRQAALAVIGQSQDDRLVDEARFLREYQAPS